MPLNFGPFNGYFWGILFWLVIKKWFTKDECRRLINSTRLFQVRRGSIRESFSEDLFPVAAPDVEAIYMSHQNER